MAGFSSFIRSIPPVTRCILGAIAIGTCFLSLSLRLLPALGLPSPVLLMGVGEWTLREGWLWQLTTYWMSATLPMQFGLSLMLYMFLDLFFIAQVSGSLERRMGGKAVALIWIGASIFGGLVGALALHWNWISGEHLLLGDRAGLAGLLIAWMMAFGEETIWILVAPLRAKWLAVGLLGLDWLQLLSNGYWPMLFASLSAALFSYVCAILIWNLHAPFQLLWKLERPLRWVGSALRGALYRWKRRRAGAQAVIIDFRTGKEIRR
jgi:hypothetical protein